MNDLEESVKKAIKEKASELKSIKEDITKMTNYQNTLETQIKSYYDIYNLKNDSVEGVKIVNVIEPKKIPLKKLLDIFPSYDIRMILENFVCSVDIDMVETENNLKFSANFQDSLVKAIIKKIDELTSENVQKVVIK